MYTTKIEETARMDLAEILIYYSNLENNQIAIRFLDQFEDCIEILKSHPLFQIRYNKIHCFPIPSFPYMIHYIVDNENMVCNVFGIISTHQNPKEKWIY